MLKTAEAVSIGHPDKTADYISCYILDRLIEQDSTVHYALEVLIKGNTVVLAGEISGNVNLDNIDNYVKDALREIGYDENYTKIWGDYAIDINKIEIIKRISVQSANINQGVEKNGWGDQGVYVGYACVGINNINHELYLARRLNKALYERALKSKNLGLDIKTQITIDDETGAIDTAIVAIPMLETEDLTDFITETLFQKPKNIIVNGTGIYQYHSAVADCGVTGRKLACDFYSTASPIGGGSPWTKDGTKADLTLNIYARYIAVKELQNNDECFVYLSSCIGKKMANGYIKTIKDGEETIKQVWYNIRPQKFIETFKLNTPIYTKLCRNGLQSIQIDKETIYKGLI